MRFQREKGAKSMDAYRGTEGTRPYAGAGWYYAEYRQRVSTEFILLLAARLGWTRATRLAVSMRSVGSMASASPLLPPLAGVHAGGTCKGRG